MIKKHVVTESSGRLNRMNIHKDNRFRATFRRDHSVFDIIICKLYKLFQNYQTDVFNKRFREQDSNKYDYVIMVLTCVTQTAIQEN